MPLELLDLTRFKVEKCQYSHSHNIKCCMFYHSHKDRRRVGVNYSNEMCQRKNCKFGDKCKKSHNNVEKIYREDFYKRKFCKHYPKNIRKCEYSQFCCYAHSEEEIRIDLYHKLPHDYDFYIFYYKTQSCPFDNFSHAKHPCVYSHSIQELRRKFSLTNYQPEMCKIHSTSQDSNFISKINDCSGHPDCKFSHNKNEYLYHPLNFKTQICPNNNCHFEHCSFYHHISEKRIIDDNLLYKITNVSPKNRRADSKVLQQAKLPSIDELGPRKITDTTYDTSNLSANPIYQQTPKNFSSKAVFFTHQRADPKELIEMKRLSGQPTK